MTTNSGSRVLEARNRPAVNRQPETFERILHGAVRIIARQGTRLSVNEVAAEARVSRATVYRYFPTRDRLVEAVEDHMVRQFAEGLESTLDDSLSGRERFRAVVEYAVAFNERVEVRHLSELQPDLAVKYLRASVERDFEQWQRVLEPAYRDLGLDQRSRLQADTLTRIVYGCVSSNMLVRGEPPETMTQDLMALFDALRESGMAP